MARNDETPNASGAPAEPEKRGWLFRRSRGSAAGVAAQPAPPPPKKPRKSGLTDLFSAMLTISLLLALVIGGFVALSQAELDRPGPLETDRTIIIERGSSTEEIVDLLEKEGVVARPALLWGLLLVRDVQSKFTSDETKKLRAKAGEYQFKRQVSMREVVEIITTGRSVEHTITIPEGLTSEQIVERLKESNLLTGDIAGIPPDGTLLPDTYKINRGTPREALLARMQREQRRVLNEVWNRRAKDVPLKSARDLVTLASIVEKETGRADERPRVAGVFINRLEKKMRLQSDPTIVYGIVGGKGTLGRAITRADIDRPTPYNTYTINGLPPGPIANPGRAAMEATANPSRTKELFFVADGTGGHVFAETLEQHNRNVARWRQIEAQRQSAQPATPAAPATPATPGLAPVEQRTPAPATNDNNAAPGATTAPGTTGSTAPPASANSFAPAARRPAAPAAADPLATRDYDLNTPKTVPNLR